LFLGRGVGEETRRRGKGLLGRGGTRGGGAVGSLQKKNSPKKKKGGEGRTPFAEKSRRRRTYREKGNMANFESWSKIAMQKGGKAVIDIEKTRAPRERRGVPGEKNLVGGRGKT